MYVGSVYWFLSMATDLSGCRVTIWDCESETVVFDSEECDDCYDIALEVDDAGFGGYDIESYDIWVGDEKVHLEINISIEEDE